MKKLWNSISRTKLRYVFYTLGSVAVILTIGLWLLLIVSEKTHQIYHSQYNYDKSIYENRDVFSPKQIEKIYKLKEVWLTEEDAAYQVIEASYDNTLTIMLLITVYSGIIVFLVFFIFKKKKFIHTCFAFTLLYVAVISYMLIAIHVVPQVKEWFNFHSMKEERVDYYIDNPDQNIIICELSLYTDIRAKHLGKIESNISRQDQPLQITFVDMLTDTPVMKWNVDTVDIVKIEAPDVIYLIEQSPVWYIALYTYFPDKRIMLVSKQYDIFWTAYWSQMMWFCR